MADAFSQESTFGKRLRVGDVGFGTFEKNFGHLGWVAPVDVTEYGGYYSDHGTGFYIWISEQEGMAYEFSTFW